MMRWNLSYRFGLLAILLLIALTGCERMDRPESEEGAILFSAGMVGGSSASVKSGAVDHSYPSHESDFINVGNSVSVYGSWTSPTGATTDIFRGVELTCEETDSELEPFRWTYSPLRYWRSEGSYNFGSVYPTNARVEYGTSGGKALNKAFHSIVLLTQNQYMRDPYEVIVNGRVKVGLNYQYDPTGATYQDTGIDVPASEGWKYAHIYKSIPGYGSVPVVSGGKGSTSLAACDGTYTSGNQTTITAVCLRFALCVGGRAGGPRARYWHNTAGNAWWNNGAAPDLLS